MYMASRRQHQPLQTGARAPEFRLARLDGGETSLHDLIANGPVLLAFFKISCPVCQMTFPFLERIHIAGTLPIYGVSQNDEEDTRDFNAASASPSLPCSTARRTTSPPATPSASPASRPCS